MCVLLPNWSPATDNGIMASKTVNPIDWLHGPWAEPHAQYKLLQPLLETDLANFSMRAVRQPPFLCCHSGYRRVG